MVECPICSKDFPENEIDAHVNKCLEGGFDVGVEEVKGKKEKMELEDLPDEAIYSCENCNHFLPLQDIYILDMCGHKICYKCLGDISRSFLAKKNVQEPVCPSCQGPISDNDATCFLDVNNYYEWQNKTYSILNELRKSPSTVCRTCNSVKKTKKALKFIHDLSSSHKDLLKVDLSVDSILFQVEATSSIKCTCTRSICVACGKDSGGELVHPPMFCPILFSVLVAETLECLNSTFQGFYQISLIASSEDDGKSKKNAASLAVSVPVVPKPKGVGFDGSANDKYTGVDAAHQKENNNRRVISNLLVLLSNLLPSSASYSPHSSLFSVIQRSCLIPLLEYYFRNDWLMEIQSQENDLYFSILKLLRGLATHPSLVGILLLPVANDTATTIFDSVKKLNKQASFVMKQSSAFESQGGDSAMNILGLALDIHTITSDIENSILSWRESKFYPYFVKHLKKNDANNDAANSNSNNNNNNNNVVQEPQKKSGGFFGFFKKKEAAPPPVAEKAAAPIVVKQKYDYIGLMKELQFEFMNPYPKSLQNVAYTYEFQNVLKTCDISPEVMIRLSQELSSLAGSLPLSDTSGIFMRVNEERINFIRFIIIGPEDTPYANGCFEFEMIIGFNYPQKPPAVQLMTTGKGSVRFNPNLYNTGKVCLSLLGTWSGPGWDPKVSTLLQVLVSIQSLILVPDPYFNEPGYESEMGTPNGTNKSKQYNSNIRCQTVRWAMIDQIKTPTPGFEEVIHNHFFLKQDAILRQVEEWANEMPGSEMPALLSQLKTQIGTLSPPKNIQ